MAELASIRPGFVTTEGLTVYPTNLEYLMAFAFRGCQWAIDALPEALAIREYEACPTANGGCI